uniref:Persimmon protein WRKY7 n=1 Tax=Diospyros kaki TaxID=35925 RepID=A0A3G5BMH8_DIOKA|nr:persimmon protein WRKY7 [Diospyros kaki]
MGTLLPGKSCGTRRRAVEKLVQGRDLAGQLQILLEKPAGGCGSVSAEELVVKILATFTETLSVLEFCDSGEDSQFPAATPVGSPSFGDQASVDSGESSKRPAAAKDRRGCYKRRKTADSWTKISNSAQDGYAWRKYGQKEILNADFPRCYYRCTHKPDLGCKATKQVQKIQEDPIIYQSTYFGHHTCGNTAQRSASQDISDDHSDPARSFILEFEPKGQISEDPPHGHGLSNFPVPVKVEEPKIKVSSSLGSIQLQDLFLMPSLEGTVKFSEHEDVISSNVYSSASTGSEGLVDDMNYLIDVDGDDFWELP